MSHDNQCNAMLCLLPNSLLNLPDLPVWRCCLRSLKFWNLTDRKIKSKYSYHMHSIISEHKAITISNVMKQDTDLITWPQSEDEISKDVA